MLGLEAIRSVAMSLNFNHSYRIGMRLRSAILAVLYKKVLSLRNLQDQTIGEIINLCTNDTQRVFEATTWGSFMISGPPLGIAMVIYSAILLGPAALIGSSMFFLAWPLQIITSKLIAKFRVSAVKITDRRVRMTNEMILSIGLIKMYAWEIPFGKKIQEIRNNEKSFLEKAGYVNSASYSVTPVVQVMAVFLTFTVHILTGNELTAATAYGVVSLFIITKIMLSSLPRSVKFTAESVVGAQRMKKLLLMEEIKPHNGVPECGDNVLEFTAATFAWDKQSNQMNATLNQSVESRLIDNADISNHGNATLFDINLTIMRGQLIGMCGSVGSGKSSIISAILSQMQLISGSVSIDGSMAYVSQQPWIVNATFKENILFGLQYDEQLYDKCIRASCLQDDIDNLPNGIETEIGERGINLSGGQKQRVSLARALYADSDIYLLDDPLSAVDTHVGQHIFNYYIKEALQGKTVLFVTHQLQYLNGCDEILVMQGGRIHESGTHKQLMTSDGHYANLIKRFHTDEGIEEDGSIDISMSNIPNSLNSDKSILFEPDVHGGSSVKIASSRISIATSVDSIGECNGGELMTKEEQSEGNVKLATYHGYIQSAGGYMISFFTIFTLFVAHGCFAASSWWLGYWITHTNTTIPTGFITENTNKAYFAYIYIILIGILLSFTTLKCILYVKCTLKASTNLHNKVFNVVFRSPMTFFDTTPSGRILNRFSKDLDEVDVQLPTTIEVMLYYSSSIFFTFLSISLVFRWYLLAFIPFSIFFIVSYSYFRHAMRELKRLENISRSPWFSHMTATIQGLSIVHAYRKQMEFYKRFTDLVDLNSIPFLLFNLTNRWIAVRLDIIAMTTSIFTSLMAVLTRGLIPPAYSGIALSYTLQNLISEAPAVTENRPPDNWPHAGAIKVNELKMRFRENLPLALRGVSFKVEPMQKIGLVGRTGAGKSSLGACLFRLREPTSGAIYIDGIDTGTLGLHDLRSRLSVIAQDPVLFVGTVRYNLDPFQQHSDEKVWSALDKCHMKSTILELEGKLDASVVENGENFSVGERQLLCMARALLRKSKILLLDEATASIDTATDSLIQQTIKDAFQDCTMLIIAHRLNTVLNCDKIMIMDQGKVIEFDKPSLLLADSNSRFSAMMAAAEKQ
ncbi:ATP-binding cassette sub-family C member 5-like [Saccoglossus kowalevskii]